MTTTTGTATGATVNVADDVTVDFCFPSSVVVIVVSLLLFGLDDGTTICCYYTFLYVNRYISKTFKHFAKPCNVPSAVAQVVFDIILS